MLSQTTGFLLGLTFIVLATEYAAGSKANSYMAKCPAYCDIWGRYVTSQLYISKSPAYCCGYTNYMYFCGNPELSIEGRYDSVDACSGSQFWYHWRMTMSLGGILLSMLFCSACCYYCCRGSYASYGYPFTRNRSRRQDGDGPSTVCSTITNPDGSIQQVFDPNQPYAFAPPQYDTLPKEPPKYADVYNQYGGHFNSAYESTGSLAEAASASAPVEEGEAPPVYSEEAPSGTLELNCQTLGPNDPSVAGQVEPAQLPSVHSSTATSTYQ